jgi:hypothetical protein
MTQTASKLDLAFTALLRRDADPGAWTIVVLPDSGRLLGTRRPVKVGGDIDGQPFRATRYRWATAPTWSRSRRPSAPRWARVTVTRSLSG